METLTFATASMVQELFALGKLCRLFYSFFHFSCMHVLVIESLRTLALRCHALHAFFAKALLNCTRLDLLHR